MNLETAVKNLTAHGFSVRVFRTAQDAANAISQELSGKTVGFGGSVTLEQMQLFETLQKNNTVYWHWKQTPAQALENARSAQVYLTSANAVSETGEIVNIDGTGNRVAATLYGPEKVYFIVGLNKLAPTLEAAIWRARNIASPLNAKRLNRRTPCALSEVMKCYDCQSPERICRGMTIHMGPMKGVGETIVVLIDEKLGY